MLSKLRYLIIDEPSKKAIEKQKKTSDEIKSLLEEQAKGALAYLKAGNAN